LVPPQVAMIWMVDSHDWERIAEAKEQLFKKFLHPSFPSPYLLIFANKQDLPSTLSGQQLIEQMDLLTLPDEVNWRVEPCCAVTGEGILEGFNWLENILGNHEEGLY